MTEPIKPWKERIDYSEPPTIKRMNDAMLEEIAELRAALAKKDEAITYHENHFANLKIEYDDLYDEHEKLEAALAAPREPMTEADMDDAYDAAVKSYRRYQGAVRGQQMRPEDVFEWHLVREVERHHGIGIKEKSK